MLANHSDTTNRVSFNTGFNDYAQRKRAQAQRLQVLADWLRTHELIDDVVQDKLLELEQQLRANKVSVAFVAEFSRGKSELINAIFFAAYGQRILPASAGRTTMCPVELGWDPKLPPCLRLLPIETRLEAPALLEWRNRPEAWTQVDLDITDADQLAQAFEKVAEVNTVSQAQAEALGFWQADTAQQSPQLDENGQVQVPRWRHALINMAHPLLQQGLVVLDTPGLNALGAEPELTINLIPKADAVVFVLGADTGVTQSDFEVWQEHLLESQHAGAVRLVVLNKIDSLWDELSSPQAIANTIQKQRETTAQVLQLSLEQVLPVSAQKGLLAKVKGDADLLERSALPGLEAELQKSILDRREDMLQAQLQRGLGTVEASVQTQMQAYERELLEQSLELKGLRGKNDTVIRHMRTRVLQEREEFSRHGARTHATKSVHMQMLQKIFGLLSTAQVQNELQALAQALRQSGLKLGVRKAYEHTFEQLAQLLHEAQDRHDEIYAMLENGFRQMNAQQGLALQLGPHLQLLPRLQELADIRAGHLRYLGVNNVLRLHQAEFLDRLIHSLLISVRAVFDSALHDIEQWNKEMASQLDIQVRERHRGFVKRLEAIERIQEAAGALDERIQEIEQLQSNQQALQNTLHRLIGDVLGRAAPAAKA